jgi:hypothetical protein
MLKSLFSQQLSGTPAKRWMLDIWSHAQIFDISSKKELLTILKGKAKAPERKNLLSVRVF